MNWGETPSGVVSNFGTGSSTEACSGEEGKKKALVIRLLEQTLKSCNKKVCGHSGFCDCDCVSAQY